MIVVVSASANETDAVDAGKSMEERRSIGVSEVEIASDVGDVELTVERESIDERKCVVVDELTGVEALAG